MLSILPDGRAGGRGRSVAGRIQAGFLSGYYNIADVA